ncbi:MAG: flagellar export protein FliJ [Defluviitoga tunisiensis]|jgi:flagellar FliJ protein|uniref:Flagellar FliJ protein n=1 Tax=Defluviitoga tunisiensis TaxID=1006576 RepID=A0A0C7P4B5_DEFTU|nr:flagellar export protein FliJ [Defluviitoga tunisiensis]MDD3600158.1 flagellar export protein FliJ [Defluviitoga tunisiensis]MDY0379430.1 flagellar export protein FliJ [Defluviitoga tunisiensis]CEP78704.1 flagellar biosynthesis chaperone [Defluviitoga tunisiensis]HHV01928.1 flagellar export protein FliJ [Defluviitoga tunisiensis]HOB54686.1 flagellar export protein FliJ [Defluviitoga tunisiensis]
MGFKYRLGRLQNLKEKFEDSARLELGKKVEERKKVEEDIRDLNKKIESFSLEFRNEIKGTVSVTKLTNMIEYKKYLNDQLNSLFKKLNEKIKEEEEALENYLQAKREKDILQKLKDKRLEDYRIEEKRQEIKDLDEVARINYIINNEK